MCENSGLIGVCVRENKRKIPLACSYSSSLKADVLQTFLIDSSFSHTHLYKSTHMRAFLLAQWELSSWK